MSDPEKIRDLAIGSCGIGLALVLIFVWIPVDIETGVVDVWRRTVRIGDAMLPTFAAIGFLLASIGVGVQAILKKTSAPVRGVSLLCAFQIVAALTVSLFLILNTGPCLAWIWLPDDMSYRNVLHLAPWKYTGFFVGGTVLVFSLISVIEHRMYWRNLVIAVIATAVIAALYDVPFDTMLLPPNGDY